LGGSRIRWCPVNSFSAFDVSPAINDASKEETGEYQQAMLILRLSGDFGFSPISRARLGIAAA
jgi:hypothetical protein